MNDPVIPDFTMNPGSFIHLMINAALRAGEAIMEIYREPYIESELKEDRSPLTRADRQANDIILSNLRSTEIPVLSEESLNSPWSERKSWTSCWIVDPLDGTKEFLKRNDEFTVNIALTLHGNPVAGVVFAPATGELYYGAAQSGAYKAILDKPVRFSLPPEKILETSQPLPFRSEGTPPLTLVASRSHSNPETHEFIETLRLDYPDLVTISRGSSLKICMVAEGIANIYPRFGPTMEWDTAAGHAIVVAAGGVMFEPESGKSLQYNKVDLKNPWFIVKGEV
jgi:3'(2'), 5'-bisphosphate nucleotidase